MLCYARDEVDLSALAMIIIGPISTVGYTFLMHSHFFILVTGRRYRLSYLSAIRKWTKKSTMTSVLITPRPGCWYVSVFYLRPQHSEGEM